MAFASRLPQYKQYGFCNSTVRGDRAWENLLVMT
jgi:hypothetical protein